MKTKVLLAIVALSYAPVAFGRNDAAYPSEKLAELVVAKLDVNSLPSVFRPKKEKERLQITDSQHKWLMEAKPSSRPQLPRGVGHQDSRQEILRNLCMRC